MDGYDRSDLTSAGLVLFYLAQHPTVTQQELASVLGVSLSQVARLTGELVANGLVRRRRNGRYERYTLATATPAPQPRSSQSTPAKLPRLLSVLQEKAASPELQATGTGGVKWLFQQVWEHSSEAMLLSSPHGIVLAANAAFVELSGYTSEELVGSDHTIMLPWRQRRPAREAYQQFFTDDSPPLEFEATILRKDGGLRRVRGRIAFLTENYKRTAMLSTIQEVAIVAPLAPLGPIVINFDREAFENRQMQVRMQARRQRAASQEIRRRLAELRLEFRRQRDRILQRELEIKAWATETRRKEEEYKGELPLSRPAGRT